MGVSFEFLEGGERDESLRRPGKSLVDRDERVRLELRNGHETAHPRIVGSLAGSDDSAKALIAKIRAELDDLATRVA